MKKKLLRIILVFTTLIIALYWPNETCCRNRVLIGKTKSLQSQLKNDDDIYIIRYDFDLTGREITMPQKCNLSFEGGSISNGIVRGNRTSISAGQKRIFNNVILAGSWSNKKVYSEWLDFKEGEGFDNQKNFKNLMLLCEGDRMTHLFMQEGTFYCSVHPESSNIQVPSNVYWHDSAKIIQLPTNYPKYGFVLLHNSENITIDGGIFVGDVQKHKGKDGEWGHGIKVAGARNVKIQNIIVKEFWGDGIDLIEALDNNGKPTINCENVKINAVKCVANRRQGLSIESGINVLISNSEFINTGKYERTAPGSGIDIDPWNDVSDKIKNIIIRRCKIMNNWGYDLQLYANAPKKNPKELDNKIKITDCVIGRSYAYKTNGVVFKKCRMNKQLEKKESYNISVH